MAKDPAFLFYPGDWLGGTMGMSFEEKGAYLDLLIFQFNRGAFTEKQAITFLKSTELWESMKSKFELNNGVYTNTRLKEEKEKRQNYSESRRQSRLKTDEDNVRIYIVRDNVRLTYKIGSSVNPQRRFAELTNQVNPAKMSDEQGSRDLTLIWFSEPVLRSEEKKIHNAFKIKYLFGEWFSLNQDDLKTIYNKYKGTYVERTTHRTENEDENENINESINTDENPKTDWNLLAPRMLSLHKKNSPNYLEDKGKDFTNLLKIAYFIFDHAKAEGSFFENTDNILEAWDAISKWASKDNFYSQKGLNTISNNIQEIAQKAIHGDKSSSGGTKANGHTIDKGKLHNAVNSRLRQ